MPSNGNAIFIACTHVIYSDKGLSEAETSLLLGDELLNAPKFVKQPLCCSSVSSFIHSIVLFFALLLDLYLLEICSNILQFYIYQIKNTPVIRSCKNSG